VCDREKGNKRIMIYGQGGWNKNSEKKKKERIKRGEMNGRSEVRTRKIRTRKVVKEEKKIRDGTRKEEEKKRRENQEEEKED